MPLSPISGAESPPMDVSYIQEAQRAGYYPSEVPREPKQEMDGEMFLSLLVTQLSNQDPGSPMDTNDMITQTTQLASMEQLTAMAAVQRELLVLQHELLTTDQREAATNLIGKVVTTDGIDGEPVTGIATAVTFSADGEPMVAIDDEPHPLSSIAAVTSVATDD